MSVPTKRTRETVRFNCECGKCIYFDFLNYAGSIRQLRTEAWGFAQKSRWRSEDYEAYCPRCDTPEERRIDIRG